MRWLFLAALFFATFSINAAPVGSPAFPDLVREGFFIPKGYWINIRLGYEGDFVGDGRLKQTIEGSGRVDNCKQETNSATATINLYDRIDIFGVLGSSRISSSWRFTESEMTSLVSMETNYDFLWGVGGRMILFEWGNTVLGAGGRYAQSSLKPVWMQINGISVPAVGTKMGWDEWQVDLGLAQKIEIFIPYVGVKYSSVRSDLGIFPFAIASNGDGALHMKNRNPVGVFVGCTLTTGKYFMLNVEGRLIDEEALSVSGDFRF
jgi:hypothetical protein